ncbi:putative G-protein coupled receptor [Pterulicium gracile]|uniref:Putative G-protein coupled receptor n=1 Tax=Pterulicium gracile TaxID=1884261 RepID=A0A5C3QRC5_9AGAR|nr:putative G-protein coupled receptor [Pterula gracilis]
MQNEQEPGPRRRPAARRQSASAKRIATRKQCNPIPRSLESLDLPSSPSQTLVSLRILLLHYFEQLEHKLRDVDSPDFDSWRAKRDDTIDEARIWAREALEMLDSIRDDVCSHLPDTPFSDMSMEMIKAKIQEADINMDVPNLEEMRSHLPDIANLCARISEMTFADFYTKFDDVRFKLNDIDFAKPLEYIPTLSEHLVNLHSHLTSPDATDHVDLDMSTWTPTIVLNEMVEYLRTSELFQNIMAVEESAATTVGSRLEALAQEVSEGLTRSVRGMKLVTNLEVPREWRSNPFVVAGYRFIPLERWPLLITSLFAFHNETLNIHTHLLPAIIWCFNLHPQWNPSFAYDTAEYAFVSFALLCLFSSAVWHTMSGCSHHASMEFCARIDYVGIGWLISASVGTVVYYGYQCQPELGRLFLSVCLVMGVLGNILPFMDWFNKYENRGMRVCFFLAMAGSAIAPVTGLAVIHGLPETLSFIAPVFPSLISYLTGLVFYTTHIPERWMSEKWCRRLNAFGGGSHCIWHLFIVLAVTQHKTAMASLREGMQCLAS